MLMPAESLTLEPPQQSRLFGERLRGVEPFAWLKDVLEKLASGWKQSDIGLLLPKPALDVAA